MTGFVIQSQILARYFMTFSLLPVIAEDKSYYSTDTNDLLWIQTILAFETFIIPHCISTITL